MILNANMTTKKIMVAVYVNFANGVLSEQGEFTAGCECTREPKLPVKYNPESTCPRWLEFLNKCMSDNDTRLLQEFFGYCMTTDIRIGQLLYLYGDAFNEKKLMREILTKMVGQKNCVEIQKRDYCDPLEMGKIEGKLVNFINGFPMKFSCKLKSILCGDKISARNLYERPYTFHPIAKIIIMDESEMEIETSSKNSRFLPIKVITTNYDFSLKLKDEINRELNGIAAWSFIGLKRVIENKWEFSV